MGINIEGIPISVLTSNTATYHIMTQHMRQKVSPPNKKNPHGKANKLVAKCIIPDDLNGREPSFWIDALSRFIKNCILKNNELVYAALRDIQIFYKNDIKDFYQLRRPGIKRGDDIRQGHLLFVAKPRSRLKITNIDLPRAPYKHSYEIILTSKDHIFGFKPCDILPDDLDLETVGYPPRPKWVPNALLNRGGCYNGKDIIEWLNFFKGKCGLKPGERAQLFIANFPKASYEEARLFWSVNIFSERLYKKYKAQ